MLYKLKAGMTGQSGLGMNYQKPVKRKGNRPMMGRSARPGSQQQAHGSLDVSALSAADVEPTYLEDGSIDNAPFDGVDKAIAQSMLDETAWELGMDSQNNVF